MVRHFANLKYYLNSTLIMDNPKIGQLCFIYIEAYKLELSCQITSPSRK